MVRVYDWTGILTVVISLLRELMNKWKTRIEHWKDGEKCVSHDSHSTTKCFYAISCKNVVKNHPIQMHPESTIFNFKTLNFVK